MGDDNALLGRLVERLGLSLAADQLEALLERLRRRPQQLELLEEAAALAGAAPFSTSPTARYEVRGSVAPGYEAVREAFESNFASGWERDAQVRVSPRGKGGGPLGQQRGAGVLHGAGWGRLRRR